MSISAFRSASAPASRLSTQDSAVSRPSSFQGGVGGASSSQKPGSRLSSPGLAALQQDGFDAGSGKGQELGKLLQDTLSVLSSIVQLVAQASGAQGLQGLTGGQDAQGVTGAKGCSGSQSSGSSFTPKDASGRPPVDLNPVAQNTGPIPPPLRQDGASPAPSQQNTPSPVTSQQGPSGGSRLGGNLPAGLEKFRGAIESAAAKTGMPAEMLAAQIWQESRGNLEAVTTNGGNGLTDTGLMQVNPNTYQELQAKHPELQGKNLADPETNILAGAFYMKDMKEQFGSVDLALRAYNSGPNGVDKSNPDAIPAGTGDATYVQKVKSFMNTLATGQGTLPA
ncbi:lytic transglycosylase domain-containing protein [Corallococcus silvisoli]|uniref:lytic transglycosylase domain-containing protein n=1 Tax=Corallococcus silvisoli TaxID=2697031 RepID=UPI001377A5A8|nr:transglycosylase SLT domain-containing protein [Corallococcus silvisoli]NBD08208.1 transglycosylase SLT domain-containing protein [Corallococcus silvisoli]